MRDAVRTSFARAMYLLGCAPPQWRDLSSRLIALYYHNFTDEGVSSNLDVPAASVRVQLERICERFEFVTAKPMLNRLFNREAVPNSRPALTLTVDDARETVLKVVPILEGLEIPLLLFVPAGLCFRYSLDGQRAWCLRYYCENERFKDASQRSAIFQHVMSASLDELRDLSEHFRAGSRIEDPISSQPLLNAQQLAALARHPLVTLGAHSMSHAPLGMLPPEWCRWEVEASARAVAAIGGDPELFAYPYGSGRAVTPTTTQILADTGIRYAFTTATLAITKRSSPLLLGRTGLNACTDRPYLWGAAGGAFEWSGRLRRRPAIERALTR
jgi:peptidoglycan/xylan/chitin deacetylase (PgdA/CDA1 family)